MAGTDVSDMKRTYRTAVAGDFPDELNIELVKECDLKYGENPNQPAAVYRFKGSTLAEFTNVRLAKTGKGGWSATNFMDVTRALEILKYFDGNAVAVMKHLIPSGFATSSLENKTEGLADLYRKARNADARSASGSIVVFNKALDKDGANALLESFVECVAAPEYEEGVMNILDGKKDLRVILYSNLDKLPKFVGDDTQGLYDLRTLPTGRLLVQKPYLTSIHGIENLVLDPMVNGKAVERKPSEKELEDMKTAWYVNFGVRSNGIVFVKDGVTLAVGSGQQERVGAVEQSIVKGCQKIMDREKVEYDPLMGIGSEKILSYALKGSVVSSDAFFPFPDSIELLARGGITGIIQPGGSIRDQEIIETVNKYQMAMAFTLERCFTHI